MLIRFTVSNFMSFKDEVEFSMVAGRGRRHPDHILTRKSKRDLRLLKTAVIYGANASGKTNLLKALEFAQQFIIDGTRPNQPIPVDPFRLDKKKEWAPSRMEFEINVETETYVYGFEADSERVHAEWLYEIRPASERMLFERNTDSAGRTEVKFGKIKLETAEHADFLTFTAWSTRPNQLYLTESIDSNISYFEPVYRWFRQKLVVIFPDSKPHPRLGLEFRDNEDYRQKFRDVIRLFDFAIEDVRLVEFDYSQDTRLPAELREHIKQSIRQLPHELDGNAIFHLPEFNIAIIVNPDQSVSSYKFETIHELDNEDRKVSFELVEESDGTQRAFELVPAVIGLLSNNYDQVYFVDELDRRLHALVTFQPD